MEPSFPVNADRVLNMSGSSGHWAIIIACLDRLAYGEAIDIDAARMASL